MALLMVESMAQSMVGSMVPRSAAWMVVLMASRLGASLVSMTDHLLVLVLVDHHFAIFFSYVFLILNLILHDVY